jgi:hypothetical protein
LGTPKREDQFTLSKLAVISKGKGREANSIDFEERQVELAVRSDDLGFHDLPSRADKRSQRRLIRGQRGDNHLDPLRTRDDVSISHDVPVRINDDTGTDAPLLFDGEADITVAAFLDSAIARRKHLDDARGDVLDKRLK